MKFLRSLLGKIHAIYFLLVFSFSFLVRYRQFKRLLIKRSTHVQAHALRVVWAKELFKRLHIDLEVIDQSGGDLRGPFVICSNHFSYLDIPVLAVAFPGFFRFVAKDDLLKIPLFGIFFRTLDFAISRSNAIKAMKTLQFVKMALERGDSIVIFPEGGIKQTAPKLSRFKHGAFSLAIESGVPILPITLVDTYERLNQDGFPEFTRGKCRVVIHPPIPTKNLGLGDLETIKKQTFACIQGTLDQYAHRS